MEEWQKSVWDDTAAVQSEILLDEAAANTVTHFLQNTGSEVSCADIIVREDDGSQPISGVEDVGLVAFGWNNQPFGFNGRSAGWLNTCSNPLDLA